jgi:hypothetical protein
VPLRQNKRGEETMRRIIKIMMVAIAGLSVLALSQIGAHSSNTPSALSQVQTPLPIHDPGPDPLAEYTALPRTLAKGVPAITPPVTEANVLDYIARHNMRDGMSVESTETPRVQFVTGAELKRIMNDNDPFWDDFASEMLVYVTANGDYSVTDMDNVVHTFHIAYRVFIARTGNLLRDGVK